jgi:hypothetical protein
MPSMASASSWVGSGDIHSGNLGFHALGIVSDATACSSVTFQTFRQSAAVLTITSATFSRCHGNAGASLGCTITATGTKFPWTATAVSTTDIRIHGVHIDVRAETTPGVDPPFCSDAGLDFTLTGTLGLGVGTQTVWDPLGKTVTFNNTSGLSEHAAALGINNRTVTVNGSVVATGSLNIAM